MGKRKRKRKWFMSLLLLFVVSFARLTHKFTRMGIISRLYCVTYYCKFGLMCDRRIVHMQMDEVCMAYAVLHTAFPHAYAHKHRRAVFSSVVLWEYSIHWILSLRLFCVCFSLFFFLLLYFSRLTVSGVTIALIIRNFYCWTFFFTVYVGVYGVPDFVDIYSLQGGDKR